MKNQSIISIMKKKQSVVDIVEILLYSIGTLSLSIFNYSYLLYFAFLYSFLIEFKKYSETKDVFCILKLFLLSIIIPNNYLILLLCIFKMKNNKLNPKIIFLVFVFLLNILLNSVHIPNILFGILFLFPVLVFYILLKDFKEELYSSFSKIVQLDKFLILLQIFSIISYLIFHFNTLSQFTGNDWVVGTFGYHQGNIFLYFILFSGLLLKKDYNRTKNKKDLLYVGICLVCAVLTNSIALIILFGFSYFIIHFLNSNLKSKMESLCFLLLVLVVFLLFTPGWIKQYIVKLTDYTYFSRNIKKVDAYKDTFITIPSQDVKFFLIGNGIGEYSSRAALTCTGKYINFYNKLFHPSVSEYTNRYILSRYIKYNLEQKQGTMYSPYSTIISIQGEFGIIGLLLFLYGIYYLLINSNKNAKTLILFFFLSCFIENYLEFAKVIFLVYLLFFIDYKDVVKIETVKK